MNKSTLRQIFFIFNISYICSNEKTKKKETTNYFHKRINSYYSIYSNGFTKSFIGKYSHKNYIETKNEQSTLF